MAFSVADVIIDVILAATVLSGVLFGAYKGVIRVLEIPFKFISSFILALLASAFLSSRVVLPLIEKPVVDKMSAYIVRRCSEDGEIPLFYRILGVTDVSLGGGIDTVARELVSPLVTIISVAVTFFVTLIVGKLIISLIFKLLNLVFTVGPLKTASRVLGSVTGFAVFFLISSLLAALVLLADTVGLLDFGIFKKFDGGFVFKFLTKFWSGIF